MLYDEEGNRLDLFWLRDAEMSEVLARLGEPGEEQTWPVSGFEARVRDWWAWGGAVKLRRVDGGPFPRPMVGLDVPHLPATLDFALSLAGLRREDAPGEPQCTPEGLVTWPNWPGVGTVQWSYVTRGLIFAELRGPGGGLADSPDATVVDIGDYLRRVA
jgi:hypothetical protein